MLVHLNDHQHVRPPLGPADAHVGHVHPKLIEDAGNAGDDAVYVPAADHQGVEGSAEADLDAVQLVHHDPAAPQAGGLKLQGSAAGAPDLQNGRVGVGLPQVHRVDGDGKAGLFGLLGRPGNPQVIRLHPQQSSYQSPVGAVAGAGLGKGAVEMNGRLHRRLPQKAPGHEANADGPCRVRTGRPNHNRPQNIKQV